MKKNSKILGNLGETIAERYFLQQGYVILKKNFRRRDGEIDLIALDDQTIVFIEVKTRSHDLLGHPADAVTPHKQIQIGKVALSYLQEKDWNNRSCRFDVLTLQMTGDQAKITHFRDAFPLSSRYRY